MHARESGRLLIRGAMVIPGTGVPASGPLDVLVENGTITRMGNAAAEKWPEADAVIDAAGKYVMPGIVNTHMHWHEERVGPMPIQYERNLYLAAGVTTAREVGGDFEKTKQWRAESAAHTIVAPRIVLYPMLRDLAQAGPAVQRYAGGDPRLVRAAKERGADGIKIIGRWIATSSRRHGRGEQARAADHRHIAVEEATARDYVDLGVNSIEHFYGVADAALDGIQDFPPEMNLATRSTGSAAPASCTRRRISTRRSSRSCSTTWSRREWRGARRCRPTRRAAT